jgi:lipid-binding SYLF domain-containing protein
MNIRRLIASLILVLFTLAGCQMPGGKADPAAAAQIDGAVDQALRNLYSSTPAARVLAKRARGILVFPGVVKAGFIGGAQYGTGALRENGRTVGYYNIVAGSYGLQAGAQSFNYAMFFMDKAALDYLKTSQGFEVGVGPSVVLVDEGMAKTLTTTTAQDDVYAFVFGQKGLMAGLGVQGSKITQINP